MDFWISGFFHSTFSLLPIPPNGTALHILTCTVWVKKIPLSFSDIFSKRYGVFRPNFTHLLNVFIYAKLQIFIELSAILTKLCHIKRDHPVHTVCSKCPPSAEMDAGIFWHFSKIVGNFWSKFYTPIVRSYLRYTTNIYRIVSNCDKVMPY